MENGFSAWIGKTESCRDTIDGAPLKGMAALLDKPQGEFRTGDAVPPLWHWFYFLNPAPQGKLAADGHPVRGDFLPPIALPRRMWAGGRLTFLNPLRVGDAVRRESRIEHIQCKRGRSGELGFVTVSHDIVGPGGSCLVEEHDIVYREKPNGRSPAAKGIAAPERCDFAKTLQGNPLLLFRYSALTFNAHRIHFDREYATLEEGYPGLVVHGPLLATLLLDLLAQSHPDKAVTQFEFKAMRPVFDLQAFQLCGLDPDQGGRAALWVKDHDGFLCMEATATVS